MKEKTQETMDRIINNAIKPNAEEIASIFIRDDIACVVYDLDPECRNVAKALGWDGKTPVFKIPKSVRKTFAHNLRVSCPDDKVTPRWLEGNRPGRIFLMVHTGTLLMNYEPEVGYTLEPGSTDPGWMN